MKKIYTKPRMLGEHFVVDEYCSTCGATGEKTYKFICDAPRGDVYYYNGSKTIELGGYYPCSETHEVTVSSVNELPFYDGFVDRDNDGVKDAGEEAIIWVEWKKHWLTGEKYEANWHASAAYKSITDIEVQRS